jgi:16S rRNA (guanine(966)-N(2))-methyltransferase RsmD
MRVIAGAAKGRRLRALPGRAVRPTADRVKEALFSIVQSRFDLAGASLLDLFAGTGALGIEGLSRGARSAVFVERDHAARRVLAANLAACGFAAHGRVMSLAGNFSQALATLAGGGERFDGVLMDPPYGRGLADLALARVAAAAVVEPGGWVVVEHHVDDALAQTYGALQLTALRRYGKTAVALFSSSPRAEQVAAS